MANVYTVTSKAFDIDTSINVAGLTALKGGVCSGTDSIFVYNGAQLGVDDNLGVNAIIYGETSAGAATSGQRYGHLVFQSGITTTFHGHPTGPSSTTFKSGVKCAPTTDTNTLISSFTILGSGTSSTIFTNKNNAFNANSRYGFFVKWGGINWGKWSLNFPSPASGGCNVFLPESAAQSVYPVHNVGDLSYDRGAMFATDTLISTATNNPNRDIPVVIDSILVDASESTGGASTTSLYRSDEAGTSATDAAATTIKRIEVIPPTSQILKVVPFVPLLTGSSTNRMYFNAMRFSLSDIRPTVTPPVNFSVSDSATDGELGATWSNGAAYTAGDKIKVKVWKTADGEASARYKYFDATLTFPPGDQRVQSRIAYLDNDEEYTARALATSDNFVESIYTETSAATPTSPAATFSNPAIGGSSPYRRFYEATHNAIRDSGNFYNVLSGTTTAASHMHLQRFKLGQPNENIHVKNLTAGPQIYVTPYACEAKPFTVDHGKQEAAVQVDIVQKTSTDAEYLAAMEFQDNIGRYLMANSDGCPNGANSTAAWTSGICANNIRISMEKPQPIEPLNAVTSYRLIVRGTLLPEV